MTKRLMGDKSLIGWTDATWNVATGCSKVSQGCHFCYAERDWKRLSANPKGVYTGRKFTDVGCHPERLNQPLRWRKPRKIFVNSMGDLFHDDVPEEFIDQVFAVMALCPQHIFQVLTKRPQRMKAYVNDEDTIERVGEFVLTRDSEAWRKHRERLFDCSYDENGKADIIELWWPLNNVWLGVSVEDQPTADERIPILAPAHAMTRFISYEPALGPVNFGLMGTAPADWGYGYVRVGCLIHQIIAGGESGPKARPPHPDWFRSVRDECQDADVPFFFKQHGEWGHGGSAPAGASGKYAIIWPDGHYCMTEQYPRSFYSFGGVVLERLGKKAAGHRLDGETWEQAP